MLILAFLIVNYRTAGLATLGELCKSVEARDSPAVDLFLNNKHFSQVRPGDRLVTIELHILHQLFQAISS